MTSQQLSFKSEADFRSPLAVEEMHRRADVTCRREGGSSSACLVARETASIVNQANHCYHNWTDVCMGRLKNKIDVYDACINGDYDKSLEFKENMCPKQVTAELLVNKCTPYKWSLFLTILFFVIVFIILFVMCKKR